MYQLVKVDKKLYVHPKDVSSIHDNGFNGSRIYFRNTERATESGMSPFEVAKAINEEIDRANAQK